MKNILALLLVTSTSITLAQIPSNGLVIHYPFSGNAIDASGNGFDGTVTGATLTTDRFSNTDASYNFDGSTDYVSIPASTQLQPDFPFSVALWLKIDAFSAVTSVAFINDEIPNIYSGCWILYSPIGAVSAGYGDGLGTGSQHRVTKHSNVQLGTTNWHFIVAVFNAENDIDLYIDCVEDPGYYSGSGNGFARSGNAGAVGRSLGHGTNSYHDGKIDDIRLYDRALTDLEIQFMCYESPCIEYVTVYDTIIVYDTLTASINVLGADDLVPVKIYPNPSSGSVFMELENYSELFSYSFRLLNALGQVVYQNEIVGKLNEIEGAEFYTSGNYILQLINPQGKIVSANKLIFTKKQ